MSDFRLVIFDVDGMLVDSQGDIVGFMFCVFVVLGKLVFVWENVLLIVGLFLDVVMQWFVLEVLLGEQIDLVDVYKQVYQDLWVVKGSVEFLLFYSGVCKVLEILYVQFYILLGVVMGKFW